MNPYYDELRGFWICKVQRAAKDNPVVKKGESYVWVKERFGNKEYFKDEIDLNSKYPIPTFEQIHQVEINILNHFKKELKFNPNLTATKFLRNLDNKL